MILSPLFDLFVVVWLGELRIKLSDFLWTFAEVKVRGLFSCPDTKMPQESDHSELPGADVFRGIMPTMTYESIDDIPIELTPEILEDLTAWAEDGDLGPVSPNALYGAEAAAAGREALIAAGVPVVGANVERSDLWGTWVSVHTGPPTATNELANTQRQPIRWESLDEESRTLTAYPVVIHIPKTGTYADLALWTQPEGGRIVHSCTTTPVTVGPGARMTVTMRFDNLPLKPTR